MSSSILLQSEKVLSRPSVSLNQSNMPVDRLADCPNGVKSRHHGSRAANLHGFAPLRVDDCETTALDGHLAHDVFRAENGLQVQPRFLANLSNVKQFATSRSGSLEGLQTIHSSRIADICCRRSSHCRALTSNGLIKGEPRIDCVLRIWSSNSVRMSSAPRKK